MPHIRFIYQAHSPLAVSFVWMKDFTICMSRQISTVYLQTLKIPNQCIYQLTNHNYETHSTIKRLASNIDVLLAVSSDFF